MTVELESTSASVENATFRTSDGAIDYKIDASGFKNRTTEIMRHGQSVGRIVMHNFSSDEIIVNGTSIKLALKGKFTTYVFFPHFKEEAILRVLFRFQKEVLPSL